MAAVTAGTSASQPKRTPRRYSPAIAPIAKQCQAHHSERLCACRPAVFQSLEVQRSTSRRPRVETDVLRPFVASAELRCTQRLRTIQRSMASGSGALTSVRSSLPPSKSVLAPPCLGYIASVPCRAYLSSRLWHGHPMTPNPSLKRSANGRPPGPGRWHTVHFHRPGPGALPSSPA